MAAVSPPEPRQPNPPLPRDTATCQPQAKVTSHTRPGLGSFAMPGRGQARQPRNVTLTPATIVDLPAVSVIQLFNYPEHSSSECSSSYDPYSDEVTGSEEERYRILRALDAADRFVEPVRNGLPRPLAGVYHGMSGFAIAAYWAATPGPACLLRSGAPPGVP
jgi:hypothetical protein